MPPGMIPQPRFTTLQFQENQRRAESGAEESKATELPWGPWRCTHGTDRGFAAARPGGRAAQQPTTAGAGAAGQSRPDPRNLRTWQQFVLGVWVARSTMLQYERLRLLRHLYQYMGREDIPGW